MTVEIWSDVVCPWCYIGKRRFESALARFAHRDEVEVVWRSFELDPNRTEDPPGNRHEHLAAKYGVTIEQAQEMTDRVSRLAADEGLSFQLEIARSGNTFDAHRLIHLGAHRGIQDRVKEAMLAAYQTQGEPIARHEALVRIAVGAGLDEAEVREVLAGDRFGDEVRADEELGRQFGITGVPFFVLDRRYGVSGAQPDDVLLEALEQAWAERTPSLRVLVPEGGADVAGDACGPDGC